ncbi:MAG: DUF417 family protein [Acidobacteriaceae bacterium]
MNRIAVTLARLGSRKDDPDRRLTRILMVIVFLLFGYQSSLNYEIRSIIPFINHRTAILWIYPAWDIGGSWMPGAAEWLLGLLILLGFWNRRLGIAGSVGACLLLASTLTILVPGPGAAFTAGTGNTAMPQARFLVEDVVLLLASLSLLRRDWLRLAQSRTASPKSAPQQHSPQNEIASEIL